MTQKTGRTALCGGAFLLLCLLTLAAAQEPPSPSAAPPRKPDSVFQRESSPVTWKTLTQPFRDLSPHLAKSMGWERGLRTGFEERAKAYFTPDGLLGLLGSGLRAGVTVVLAFLLWRFLLPFLLRARRSAEEKPRAAAALSARVGVRLGRDILFWGLVGSTGSLVIWFFDASEPLQVTAISILASLVLLRIGRSLLTILLDPASRPDRLIPYNDAGAAHVFGYLNRMLFFAAVWWPVTQFFAAIGYHGDFQELLWVIFRLVIFVLLILLVSNKNLVLASILAGTWIGRRVLGWTQNLYPAVIGLIVGVFGLYSLGYVRLAQFIVASIGYSLGVLAVTAPVAGWFRRLQRTPARTVEPEIQLLPVSQERWTRFRDRCLNLCAMGVWAGAALAVLSIWGLDLKSLRRAAVPLTATLFTIGETKVSAWVLVQVALLLGATVLVSRSVRMVLKRRVLPRTHVDLATQHTLLSTLNYVFLAIGSVIALQTIGVDLTAFAVIAGALGVGIGFGLQNIANNFISGLILLMERPVKVGDFIDVAGTLGIVERIGARCTVVQTLDNIAVLVPNSSFISERVVNWSYGSPVTRLHVRVGVAYGSDTALVEKTLLDVGKAHPLILADPPPRVSFTGFQDSALGFDLLVWTDQPAKNMPIISDLNFAVDRAFREKGITIPFPQQDLHVRSSIPLPFGDSLKEGKGQPFPSANPESRG